MEEVAGMASSHPLLQKYQRRLSSATTAAGSFSSSSFSSDAGARDNWMSSSFASIEIDVSDDDSTTTNNDSNTYTPATVIHSLQNENAQLRRDLDTLQDAHALAQHYRKQMEMLEMEMLIRGSASRASLTGLLSSLELRESFRSDRLSVSAAVAAAADCDGYDSSDSNERVSMLGGDGIDNYAYDSDDAIDGTAVLGAYSYATDTNNHYDDSDLMQPEEERECDALRASFFVDKFIDPNGSTDDECDCDDRDVEDVGAPETSVEPGCCVDCDALKHALVTAQTRVAALEARLASSSLSPPHSTYNSNSDSNTYSHTQERISELEAELAHANALVSNQTALLDALQSDFHAGNDSNNSTSEDAQLLHMESSEAAGSNNDVWRRSVHSWLLAVQNWRYVHVATLLVGLALLCAALYSLSGGR